MLDVGWLEWSVAQFKGFPRALPAPQGVIVREAVANFDHDHGSGLLLKRPVCDDPGVVTRGDPGGPVSSKIKKIQGSTQL